MPECAGPLWPCGLTGAAACLSGLQKIAVVIHGSEGCYFYPATTLHVPLYCTSLTDQDIILGTDEALIRTIDGIGKKVRDMYVICSCVPSITGEDVRATLESRYGENAGIHVLDSPGFSGEYEKGYLAALSSLNLRESGEMNTCINIDGISLMDPFWRGNLQEVERMIRLAGAGVGARLCSCNAGCEIEIAPSTIHANPDLVSEKGSSLGSLLGIREIRKTVRTLEDRFPESEGVLSGLHLPEAEEHIVAACDKYLRRFDPPDVVLAGQCASMQAIAGMLDEYLGAGILGIASRNVPGEGQYPAMWVRDYAGILEMLEREEPDLVLGSSFEQTAYPSAAWVGITPPLRGAVRLHARPIAGIEGALALMESVLNACIDRQKVT
ncbi:MAG: nitrogenase component 1 [Methanolinea sp.]|nr:oxidoreductase [Methanolinea sp.]